MKSLSVSEVQAQFEYIAANLVNGSEPIEMRLSDGRAVMLMSLKQYENPDVRPDDDYKKP